MWPSLRRHARWAGKGYPGGLAGRDIPLSARLIAAANVYDALISRRACKDAFSYEQAAEIVVQWAQFDPDVVDAFLAIGGALRTIAERYGD